MNRRLAAFALASVLAACGDDTAADGAGGAGGAGGGPSDGGGDDGGGGVAAVPFEAEVVRYDVTVNVDTLVQDVTLALDVASPGGTCWSVASELEPTAVSFDDAVAASMAVDDAELTACASTMLEAGDHTLTATVPLDEGTFHNLDVGLSENASLAGTPFTYLLSWVGGCDHFGPCDDDPSKLVHFTFEIEHPAGTVALCPGTLVAGETSTRCELTTTRAPTYSAFAWMTDPGWVRNELLSAGGVDVVFYEVPGGNLANAIDPVSLTAFLEWSTERFGPLPFGSELRFAGGPTAWLGFEHPANIVLQEELDALGLPYADGLFHVTMHEVIHQWAGDATTLASPQDFAWKEAIAEYVSFVFEDEMRPEGEAEATLAYWDSISPQASFHVRPTDEPPPDVPVFYGDVYGPGPMVLFVQLEDMLGRDVVMEGIIAFLGTGGVRSVEDLRIALEEASGEELAAYFDAWVFGAGAPTWPAFSVETQDNGDGTITVTATQTQEGAPFPCVVEIAVAGATTSAVARIDFGLAPAAAGASATIAFGEAVTDTTVDPRNRIVDVSAGVSAVKLPVYIF